LWTAQALAAWGGRVFFIVAVSAVVVWCVRQLVRQLVGYFVCFVELVWRQIRVLVGAGFLLELRGEVVEVDLAIDLELSFAEVEREGGGLEVDVAAQKKRRAHEENADDAGIGSHVSLLPQV
jgi:hypothetical protein